METKTKPVTAVSVKQAWYLVSKGAKEIIGTPKMTDNINADDAISLYNLLDKITFLNDKNEVRNDVLKDYLIEELRKHKEANDFSIDNIINLYKSLDKFAFLDDNLEEYLIEALKEQGPTLHVTVPTRKTSWGATTLNYKGWKSKLLTLQNMMFDKELVKYERQYWAEDFPSTSLEDAEFIIKDKFGNDKAMKNAEYIDYTIKPMFKDFVIETNQKQCVLYGMEYYKKRTFVVHKAVKILDENGKETGLTRLSLSEVVDGYDTYNDIHVYSNKYNDEDYIKYKQKLNLIL